MTSKILSAYRSLPWFKGKLRLGKLLFNKYINHPEPVYFKGHGGIKYHLPNTQENLGVELMINGIYEEDIVRFLKHHIPDNTVYFDIGANIGSLGLPVVKGKSQIQYYGFEASPMVFEYLQKNFAANDIKNYVLLNKLVHKDNHQSLKFYQSNLYGKSSMAPTYSSEYIMIESLSIDHFCELNMIKRINWIKVDVQGFEIFVFEGMQELLKHQLVDNILFEFEPWAEEQAGLPVGIARDYIQQMGYELYTLKGKLWDANKEANDTMIWAKPLIKKL